MADEVDVLVRVLGPVDVVDGARQNVPLRGPVQARLLAVLVAAAPNAVSVDDLAAAFWPDGDMPDDPTSTLRTYVARLRRALGPSSVVTATGSYRLGEVETDLNQFVNFIERARRASGSPTVADIWRQAIDLWRGPAFGEFSAMDLVSDEARRLGELRAEATEAWFDARLAAGEGRELAADVDRAVAEFPLREGFRAQQMTVLSRAGRAGEALRAFQDFRSDLTDIGLEPSPRLTELDQEIARGEIPRSGARRTLRGYELSDRLGEGAFAVVHYATQASVDRPVAIKQIRGQLADQSAFIAQFEAEAHLVARLEHPHIVPLYDYWREPGSAYLVMRYLDGGSLAGQLVDGPMLLPKAVGLTQQVAAGLDAAHRAEVIHRDVKPANILLDQSGNAYLSDFGIAVEEAERLDPQAWLSNGSPAYASPEQLRREPVGPAADVYALGVTIYEALTARLPFPAETTMAGLLNRQLEDPIPLVRSTNPEVPAAVDTVLQKATAKDPAQRYASASDMASDLARAAGLEGDAELVSIVDRNPYKGLRAFDEADAADFSGRDRLVAQLLETVGEQQVVAVVGPSGSGKSSAVRAGLLPAIRNGRWPGSDQWLITTMTPGIEPFADLEAALLRVAVDPPADLERKLTEQATGLAWAVRHLTPDNRELALVVDQFEELFTLATAENCQRFLDALVAAVEDAQSRVRLILTLRADFYDRPLRHPGFAQLIRSATVPVHPLGADELERVITEPASAVGARFDAGLVAAITADVADEPGALPLLQYALTELFEAREPTSAGSVMLTTTAYEEVGGVGGALARRAEEQFQSLDSDRQSASRQIFSRLVSLGEGTEDTRRRVGRSELSPRRSTDSVLEVFGSARLLSFDRDPSTREPTVEVAHEALIREWPRLRGWLEDDRDGLRILRHITESAGTWDTGDRPGAELYRGSRLEAAETFASERRGELTDVEAAFLDAGITARQEEAAAEAERLEAERRSNRRLRRLLAGVAVTLALALVAGVIAVQQRGAAQDSAAEAETRRLVADAAAIVDENVDIGLLMAAEAYRRDPTPAGLAGLQRVLKSTGTYLGRLGAGTSYQGVESIGDQIVGIAGSEVHVYDSDQRKIETVIDLPAPNAVAKGITPVADIAVVEGLLAFPLEGGSVVIVDLRDDSTTIVEHGVEVTAVALDAEGELLAVGDQLRGIAVYNVSTQSQLWRSNGFPEATWDDVDYGDVDPTDHPLHDLYESPGIVDAVFGPKIQGLIFDEKGDVVAAASASMRRFDAGSGATVGSNAATTDVAVPGFVVPAPPGVIVSRDDHFFTFNRVRFARYSSDLELLDYGAIESGRDDGNVATVDLDFDAGGGLLALLSDGRLTTGIRGEAGALESIVSTEATAPTGLALSPDGRTVAISSDDGIVLTSLDGSQLLAVGTARDGHALVSPDPTGRFLALSTLGSGRPPVLVDLETGERRSMIQTHQSDDSMFFIQGGHGGALVGGSPEASMLLDPQTLEVTHQLVVSYDFGEVVSPEGDLLVVGKGAAPGAVLTFIDLESGSTTGTLDLTPWVFDPSIDAVLRISTMSPDGETMLSVFPSGRAVEIDVASRTVTRTIDPNPDGSGGMTTATFSPDGELLATRDLAGQTVLRSATTYEELATLEGGQTAFENLTYGPFFTPDSRYLLTTREQRPRLWDLETRTELGTFPVDDGLATEAATGESALHLATGVGDHALIWNLNTDEWFDIACQAAGRNFTAGEWEQFSPKNVPYQATCPQWPPLG